MLCILFERDGSISHLSWEICWVQRLRELVCVSHMVVHSLPHTFSIIYYWFLLSKVKVSCFTYCWGYQRMFLFFSFEWNHSWTLYITFFNGYFEYPFFEKNPSNIQKYNSIVEVFFYLSLRESVGDCMPSHHVFMYSLLYAFMIINC